MANGIDTSMSSHQYNDRIPLKNIQSAREGTAHRSNYNERDQGIDKYLSDQLKFNTSPKLLGHLFKEENMRPGFLSHQLSPKNVLFPEAKVNFTTENVARFKSARGDITTESPLSQWCRKIERSRDRANTTSNTNTYNQNINTVTPVVFQFLTPQQNSRGLFKSP